jgi:hypothetical protein
MRYLKIATLTFLTVVLGICGGSSPLLAAETAGEVNQAAPQTTSQAKPPAVKEAPAIAKKGVSTEVNFEDLLVQGKYHFSDEAVTTVEDDKALDGLLGIRTEFKDRIKQSASRR